MALPFTFQNQNGPIPLSELDANFSYLSANNAVGPVKSVQTYFGAVGDGITDDTVAVNTAANSGFPLDWGNGKYNHSGILATTTGNLYWFGEGAQLNYTGVGNGVWITTAPSTNATGVYLRGMTFNGGQTQLAIRGDITTKAILSDVKVFQCECNGTIGGVANAGLYVGYAYGVEVAGCTTKNCTDNGIYVAFSSRVNVHHNLVWNCLGSGGIAVGYCDQVMSPAFNAFDNVIDSNIVFNDSNAAAGATSFYISGIDVVFSSNVVVTNNIIGNTQASLAIGTSIKAGIVVEEYACYDVVVQGNQIYNVYEDLIRIGTNPNSDIQRLKIRGNYGYKAGQHGIRVDQSTDGLEITDNTIDTTNFDGIVTYPTVSADTLIRNNTLRHVGITPTFCTYQAVMIEGINATVENNNIETGHVAIYVSSTATTPKVNIDPSTYTITLTDGAGTTNTNYQSLTFSGVAAWISGRTNWAASIYPSTPTAYNGATNYTANQCVTSGGLVYRCIVQAAGGTTGNAPPNATYWVPMSLEGTLNAGTYLRRTGERSGSVARDYTVPAAGLKLTSYECYVAIYTAFSNNSNCRVRGNIVNTHVMEYINQTVTTSQWPFAQGQMFLFQASDTLSDVLESGGGRTYYGSAHGGVTTPAALPTFNYYIKGDVFYPSDPSVLPGRWTCFTSGLGTASVWKPLTGTASGVTTGIATGASATAAVTVTGVLLSAENLVSVSVDTVSLQGLKVWGYVSANNTVTVRYENSTGGTITLAAHTLHVYVS